MYRVIHTGVENVLLETENVVECWSYIHRHTSYSVHHACKYEGYSIQVLKGNVWEDVPV